MRHLLVFVRTVPCFCWPVLLALLIPLGSGCSTARSSRSLPVPVGSEPELLPKPEQAPQSLVVKPTRMVPRRDQKGVGALFLVLEQRGRTTDVSVLHSALAQMEDGGLPHEDALAVLAKAQGLWAHAQYGRLDRLAERMKPGISVMVQLQDEPDRIQSRYFALVDRYDTTGRVLRVRTGDGLPLAFSEGEFWRRWERVRFWMMTLGQPENGTWELSALEYASRMQFYDAMGRYELGDLDAAKALLLEGKNCELCISIAVRERSRERPEAAESLLRKVVAKGDSYVRAANNLAYLLAEQGHDLPEAEQFARTCVAREPTNPRVLDTLGFVLQTQGRWAEALPVYESAYLRARYATLAVRREIGLHLAQTYLALERRPEATRVTKELLNLDPNLLLPPALSALVP